MEIKEILKLEAAIRYHDYLYYIQDNPIISDTVYDDLKKQFLEMVSQCPDYSVRVLAEFQSKTETLVKFPIVNKWQSYRKFTTPETFRKYIKANFKDSINYEAGVSGLRCRLVYENGVLTTLYTSGTNDDGINITHRLSIVKDIPYNISKLSEEKSVEITGILYSTVAGFTRYKEEIENLNLDYLTVLNSTMKTLDPVGEGKELDVYFKAYDISSKPEDIETYTDLKIHINELGFDTTESLPTGLVTEMLECISQPIMLYPVDCIIAKVDTLVNWDEMIACKFSFPKLVFTTSVIRCEWESDMFGVFTPTLVCETVQDKETVVSTVVKLPQHNLFIKSGIRIGSIISVVKGDSGSYSAVNIIKNGKGDKITPPKECPCCGSPIVENEPGVYQCSGDNCPGKFVTMLHRLSNRNGFGLSIEKDQITDLVDMGKISSVSDIFKLKEEDLTSAGISEVNKDIILSEIKSLVDGTKHNPLPVWLYVAGIPSIGRIRAIELASNFAADSLIKTPLDIVNKMKDGKWMFETFGLSILPAVNYVTRYSDQLLDLLGHMPSAGMDNLDIGLTPVTLTGSWYVSVEELREKLIEYDFYLDTQVTRLTTAVLAGSSPSPSKITRAQELDVKVIDINNITSIETLVYSLLNVR